MECNLGWNDTRDFKIERARSVKFCIHFLIAERIIYQLLRHKFSKTFEVLCLNVTKKEKKNRWNTTYSTCRFRIARKVPFSIFCKLQPITELQKLYEKDKKTDKIFKGWYWLIEECTVKISRSNQKNRAGHAFISFQYASLSGQN